MTTEWDERLWSRKLHGANAARPTNQHARQQGMSPALRLAYKSARECVPTTYRDIQPQQQQQQQQRLPHCCNASNSRTRKSTSSDDRRKWNETCRRFTISAFTSKSSYSVPPNVADCVSTTFCFYCRQVRSMSSSSSLTTCRQLLCPQFCRNVKISRSSLWKFRFSFPLSRIRSILLQSWRSSSSILEVRRLPIEFDDFVTGRSAGRKGKLVRVF